MLQKIYRDQCVAAYLKAGYFLFPISTKTKKPFYKYWNILTQNDVNWIKPLTAFGVALGAQDMVLDYDPRRDDDHPHMPNCQLKKFLKLLGYSSPIKTLVVKTARGGYHVYLKKSESLEIAMSFYVPNFPAIEIKRKNQFVVGAGSVINGVQYKIVRR